MRDLERKNGSELRTYEQIEEIRQQAAERCRELEKRIIASDTEAAQLRFALTQIDGGQTQLRPRKEEDCEALRRFVECGVCTARVRNVVISKCSHSFCSTCLDTCLRNRTADCPACKQSFEQADLRPLYWQ